MTDYDDEELNDDYLDEDSMDDLSSRTTESGDLLDDSNPFGYDDMDDDYEEEHEIDEDD